jgi:hypothetical protein
MAVTTSEAIARVRERLNAGSYGFPLYFEGDDAALLPDTPSPFAFVAFNNEGEIAVSFGGGRGNNVYRNRMRVEAFVFSPMGYGAETVAAYAEPVAAQLRSYRDDVISCFGAGVFPVGSGSTLSVPGLSSDISNYQCAVAEAVVIFDLVG